MAGFDGALALVLVDMSVAQDGSDYQAVAAQTSFETETTRNMLDGAVKGTPHADSAYGRMESTASMEGLVALGDATQAKLQEAMEERKVLVLQYGIDSDDDGDYDYVYQAPALVASISRSFPDNENSTFNVEFTINNPGWTQETP
jgi:TP901-1 family phage major tail protein